MCGKLYAFSYTLTPLDVRKKAYIYIDVHSYEHTSVHREGKTVREGEREKVKQGKKQHWK